MKRYRITYKNTSFDAPEGEFLIGRSSECHLVLDDPSVSRIHAVIVRDKDELRIEDRGSRNGVLVNKERIRGPRVLADKDQVIIGHQVIRVALLSGGADGERTQGIMRCPSCGAWSAGDSSQCAVCGAALSFPSSFAAENTDLKAKQTQAGGRPTFSMFVELAHKAVQVGKLEEAERIVSGILSSAETRLKDGDPLQEGDLEKIANVAASLARAAKSPKEISRIFSLHSAAKKLMSRELVEKLYDVVRPAGYLVCPEMTRYLGFLDAMSQSFNPGELFVHRRLQGLVKLCS